ncbi:hypothetical protein CBR_g2702 [Chara braunii]|uniref:DUF4360 domain-containing protein n=1 Tax=Chara braunii TaxID=69332 RepID=A0A388KDP2_CHABU|nr:hypothetical protein CBR_g2702 [Chara braunii]|eukprot:GBG68151.1 hypothetical protein CBR_g2702 [Chara braunii]
MAMARSTFVAAVLLLIVALQASAQPPEVTISYVTYAGSGCNGENTNYALSNDNKVVTFMFGGMVATTDEGLAGKRKHCQMSFNMVYPDGWSVSIGQATGRGFANIAKKSKGHYESHYYFAGQTGTASLAREVPGPQTGNFEFTDDFLTIVWSECNNAPNLNIKVVVRVEGKKAVMALDSQDTRFQLAFNLQWTTCPST